MTTLDSLSPPHVYRLVCRPALPKDTPDVMELTRTIWDGHDYVPQVWDAWLHDQDGLLAVAEYGGRVVGTGKLTRLGAGEWWLEGLRVHPEFEGRGIASHIQDYTLDFWRRQGGGTIRLVTGSSRKAVHRLCERTGFLKTGEYTVFAAEAATSTEELVGSFTSLHKGEQHAALDFARDLHTDLMDLGWQWVSPSLDRLREAIFQGQAWWWRPRSGERRALLAARIGEDDEAGQALVVSLLACPPAELTACLHDFRWLSGAMGQSRVAWFAPLGVGLEPSLEAAGFQREWEDALFLFEKS
jgi:GNAT superfamily N-acetyltransferase